MIKKIPHKMYITQVTHHMDPLKKSNCVKHKQGPSVSNKVWLEFFQFTQVTFKPERNASVAVIILQICPVSKTLNSNYIRNEKPSGFFPTLEFKGSSFSSLCKYFSLNSSKAICTISEVVQFYI